jgi:gamma-glutamyltranspeptidase/glutathione hydrolase
MSIASQAIGREGMVVAGHPSAADVALRTLRAGGSVADAAIAGAAVMTVALPQACTLGGDAFALVHDAAQNETIGLNASGPSPASTAPAAFASGIPERGALTCTMPGVVGGWQGLHDRFGRVPWRELLQPAMAMAREGFALSKGVARATEVYAKLLDSDPGSRALFRRDGRPLQLGERLVQAALAQTLEMTATEGRVASTRARSPRASRTHARRKAGGCARAISAAMRPNGWRRSPPAIAITTCA